MPRDPVRRRANGDAGRGRTGRPPRIHPEAIAKAVVEIGFDDVTVKRTAEHMGVSAPALYHYVNGRDDLVAMAAEYSLRQVELPVYDGQDWRTWLREWAHYIRTAIAGQPELFQHFLAGGIDDDRFVDVVGAALEPLVELGFTPVEAMEVWDAVSAVALGSVAGDIRERVSARSGRPWMARMHGALAKRDDQFPALREVVERGRAPDLDQEFERRLEFVLAGIAASRL